MTTILVVPAWSDQADQCRIVCNPRAVPNALRAYREDDGRGWRNVGLMNSRGEVVCIEPEFNALRDDQPLMAGVTYSL